MVAASRYAPIAVTEILGFRQTYRWYTGQPFEFPSIAEAINAVVARSAPGLLKRGAIVLLPNEDFNDMIGHLTSHGAQKSKELIFKFYHIAEAA